MSINQKTTLMQMALLLLKAKCLILFPVVGKAFLRIGLGNIQTTGKIESQIDTFNKSHYKNSVTLWYFRKF